MAERRGNNLEVEKKQATERLAELIEKSRVMANLEMLLDKRKLLWNNFLAGLAKGLGFGVGLTVLAAVVIYFLVTILKSLVALNIPIIGNHIVDLVQFVQDHIQNQR
ncbi:MAG: DUF5665 domain-containing protein [Thermovirgaceae bacterium]|jgi:hypothetical protein|nr:hypothetical protein [Thermovirga sp.]